MGNGEEPFNWDLDMESALDLDFEGWQPQPGDKIVGTVLAVALSEPGQWGQYPILQVATREGGVSVHCFHSVLRKAISNVVPGDFIGVKYKGEKQGANQTYADYNVIVKSQSGAISGGTVSAALPVPEAPALPAPEPEQPPSEPGQATLAPEPAPAASTMQRNAIDKLRADQGLPALDWENQPLSMAQAREHIRELQS